jgi:hypothetical protein
LSDEEIAKIKLLLIGTDMSFGDIAARMDCAKSSIIAINRKSQIRLYNGCRTRWTFAVEENRASDSV